MAESSNKQNIEDVLSSIRRLVSDEDDHAPRAPIPGLRPEKLVLTPQLRVTEPEDPYQTIRALSPSDLAVDAMDEASLEDAPDADVLMTPVSGQGRVGGVSALDPALQRAFAAPADDNVPELESSGVTTAEPESTPLDTSGAAQTEASAEGDHTATAEAPMVELAFDEASMDQPFEATARLTPVDLEDETLEAPDDSGVQAVPTDFPEGPQDPPQAPLEAIPFPQDKVQRSSEPKAQDADDVLDEETLREIIAEVVREEFAGQLGERITRNVRKLVRREIRQILASEDLD
jgi:hypothetical protein